MVIRVALSECCELSSNNSNTFWKFSPVKETCCVVALVRAAAYTFNFLCFSFCQGDLGLGGDSRAASYIPLGTSQDTVESTL